MVLHTSCLSRVCLEVFAGSEQVLWCGGVLIMTNITNIVFINSIIIKYIDMDNNLICYI